MGGKYKTQYDQNPPVGLYEVAEANNSVLKSSVGAKMSPSRIDRSSFTDKRVQ